MQRRHQKIIEEAPAAVVDPKTFEEMEMVRGMRGEEEREGGGIRRRWKGNGSVGGEGEESKETDIASKGDGQISP